MDVASLVSAWDALVLHLAFVFTEATARTWRQMAMGWVLHRGPATVTGIFRTLGRLADRHWTVYEKFFYRAVWSLDQLCFYLMVRVVGPMIMDSGVIDPALDDHEADRRIPPAKRKRVLARDRRRCRHCGSPHRLHVHHIIPWSQGGRTVMRNLITMCRSCHALIHAGHQL